jgi:flagellar motor protein MotB
MNRQSQWLFEAPASSEAAPYTHLEYYSLPEEEAEWEQSPSSLSRGQTIRETVSGFSRYSHSATLLPSQEQQKIDRVARLIIKRFNFGQRPIHIRLLGHADKDSPRRLPFEKKISSDRALEIQNTLIRAIDNPVITTQIIWERRAMGAIRPVVAKTVSEKERWRNRRVEILINPGNLATRQHYRQGRTK